MWPFKKKSARRLELRRVAPPRNGSKLELIRKFVYVRTILVGLGCVVTCSAVILYGGQRMPWQLFQKPDRNLLVRRNFRLEDPQATAQAREQAKQSTPNYYQLNTVLFEQIEQDLTGLLNQAKAVKSYDDLPKDRQKLVKKQWNIGPEQFGQLRESLDATPAKQISDGLEEMQQALQSSLLIAVMPDEYRKAGTVVLGKAGQGIQTTDCTFVTDNDSAQQIIDQSVVILPTVLSGPLRHYLKRDIQPVWQFDQARTDKQRQLRYESKDNQQYHSFTPGQLLVGSDQVISQADLGLLKLEHRAYLESLSARQVFLSRLGVVTAVALLVGVLGVYCYKYYYRVVQNWSRALAVAALLTVLLLVVRVMELGLGSWWNQFGAVFSVSMMAMVLTIAYDQRMALAGALILACMTLLALQSGFDLFLVVMVAAWSIIFAMGEIRSRSKIVKVATGAAGVVFAACWALGFAQFQQWEYILRNGLACALGAIVAGLLVQGILPAIERLFRIATSMTLLEWCDASKPLLRRLALEAPGTFNHSLLIGSMAETAADAVDANGLLARVGAYYHDIGKINKPHYFVENQPDLNMTRHRNLSPAMSLLIIIGHVKDGLELAKEYSLPRLLHQFISQHHGTTLVEYFYRTASQQRSEGSPPVSDTEFRYPGPKPHSKETAILMLCDTVEGAVRSLSEPTAGRIESVVHQMATKRLQDGQFDQCDLTLRELHLVEESLTKSLCAIYHSRITYPTEQTKDAGSDAGSKPLNGSNRAERKISANP